MSRGDSSDSLVPGAFQDVDIHGSSLDLLSPAPLSIPEPTEPLSGSYRAAEYQHRHYINTCGGACVREWMNRWGDEEREARKEDRGNTGRKSWSEEGDRECGGGGAERGR